MLRSRNRPNWYSGGARGIRVLAAVKEIHLNKIERGIGRSANSAGNAKCTIKGGDSTKA